jgi:hypothetical protein
MIFCYGYILIGAFKINESTRGVGNYLQQFSKIRFQGSEA